MQINLSEETIKTVCDVLESEKRFLINLICNEKDMRKERKYRKRLVQVENAQQIFEEVKQESNLEK